MLATDREIIIRFPDCFAWAVQPVPEEHLGRFPERLQPKLSVLRIRYAPGATPTILGFGKEFANPGHPSHGWLLRDDVMVSGMTLREFANQDEFMLVVGGSNATHLENWLKRSPAVSFTYPYGTEHSWNVEVMEGHQFQLRTVFECDNEHVAVVTQQVV
jgi:hypothetical protein